MKHKIVILAAVLIVGGLSVLCVKSYHQHRARHATEAQAAVVQLDRQITQGQAHEATLRAEVLRLSGECQKAAAAQKTLPAYLLAKQPALHCAPQSL